MFMMLMFMLLMTVLIMTPSIRTSLGTTADPILSPLLPEESFFAVSYTHLTLPTSGEV